MQTPASKNPTELSRPSQHKVLPSLPVIKVARSSRLKLLYQLVYALIAVLSSLALMPWLERQLIWWLVLVAWLVGTWIAYQRQTARIFSGAIWIERERWFLKTRRHTSAYVLDGEIVRWPLLIVVPLQDLRTKTRRHLVIMSDALSTEDNALLRRWLRVCMRPVG